MSAIGTAGAQASFELGCSRVGATLQLLCLLDGGGVSRALGGRSRSLSGLLSPHRWWHGCRVQRRRTQARMRREPIPSLVSALVGSLSLPLRGRDSLPVGARRRRCEVPTLLLQIVQIRKNALGLRGSRRIPLEVRESRDLRLRAQVCAREPVVLDQHRGSLRRLRSGRCGWRLGDLSRRGPRRRPRRIYPLLRRGLFDHPSGRLPPRLGLGLGRK